MKLFLSKDDEMAIEKIRQDENCRKYAVLKNWGIVIMSILVLSYTIPDLISAIYNNAPNEAKMMPILWSIFVLVYLIETAINLKKLKKAK